jgi:hypothetical protein
MLHLRFSRRYCEGNLLICNVMQSEDSTTFQKHVLTHLQSQGLPQAEAGGKQS